jgi:hypothetical protein
LCLASQPERAASLLFFALPLRAVGVCRGKHPDGRFHGSCNNADTIPHLCVLMKTTMYIFTACGIAMLAANGAASAVALHCPATIAVTHTVTDAPQAWQANDAQRTHALRGAGFTSGPPSKMAFLMPDSITRDGKLSIATTSVGGGVLGGDWLNCTYEGTAATVAQALPHFAFALRGIR